MFDGVKCSGEAKAELKCVEVDEEDDSIINPFNVEENCNKVKHIHYAKISIVKLGIRKNVGCEMSFLYWYRERNEIESQARVALTVT